MKRYSRILLPALVWLGAAFRYRGLFANHFHADEALFASWARLIAVWRDPLLVNQAVDKPPLSFYLAASFYPLLGPVEWAARLPAFVAGLLLVPLTGMLAWRVYKDEGTALSAAAFVALSPLAISLSATVFTDALLTALLTVALLLACSRSRPALSGLFLGLSVATKHQAWLFLPLVLALGWRGAWRREQWLRWLGAFLAVVGALLLWEVARGGRLLLWSRQVQNFGGLRLVWSWELLPRLNAWWQLSQLVWGSSLLPVLWLLGVPLLWLHARRSPQAQTMNDLLLILFSGSYLLLHGLLAIPVWDRYLLPLLPVAATLAARLLVVLARGGATWLEDRLAHARRLAWLPAALVALVVLFPLVTGAQAAREGGLPAGGGPTADQGAWEVAGYLRDSPYGTVLYDHWFSWHWRYHFFDRGVYVSWFPHPQALATDLSVFGRRAGARYIVLPATPVALPVRRAVHEAGFRLEPVLRTVAVPGMVLYRLAAS